MAACSTDHSPLTFQPVRDYFLSVSLTSGSKLGVYEILAPLGAGGMGEVHRARDSKLGREVAIKVLPEEVAADRERLRRFEQEPRAASPLRPALRRTDPPHELPRVGSCELKKDPLFS